MTRHVGIAVGLLLVFILLLGASTARADGYVYTVTVDSTSPFLSPPSAAWGDLNIF